MTSTLCEHRLCTFMITCGGILLIPRNVLDKSRKEKQNTYFIFNNSFSEKIAVYQIMQKKYVTELDRPQMTIWRMHFTCWITQATNTHTEYVTLVTFPLPQWLHECTTILHYTYTACLVSVDLYITSSSSVTSYVLIDLVRPCLIRTYLLHGAESFLRS